MEKVVIVGTSAGASLIQAAFRTVPASRLQVSWPLSTSSATPEVSGHQSSLFGLH